jgi:hypothetical protein
MVENSQICNLQIGSLTKVADQSKEIVDLKYADLHISKICRILIAD